MTTFYQTVHAATCQKKMASEAASLLDQLMGTTRNAVPGENVKELSWSDEEVCKYYLCGFCPSVLFVNTKAEATVGENL